MSELETVYDAETGKSEDEANIPSDDESSVGDSDVDSQMDGSEIGGDDDAEEPDEAEPGEADEPDEAAEPDEPEPDEAEPGDAEEPDDIGLMQQPYEDVDSEEEEDEDYLEKFDKDVRSNFIDMYHPEVKAINHEELKKMATVTRNEHGVIIDDLHRTNPMMTKYEYTSILGQRAEQIDRGDSPMVKVPNGVMDGYLIAQMELEQNKLPFIIKRPIPGSGFEYWHVQDLEIMISI